MALYDDPRSAWTSRTPTGRVRIAPSTRDGVCWHWAGPKVGLFGKSHAACLSQVRSWESYHMSKGWNSIGYNGLICVHARVIEGRGFDFRGAHAGPTGNDPTYGVQFMLGQGESPSSAMYDRAYRLERALWEHSGHRLASSGHRDFMQTDCPGDGVYKWAHSTHTLSGGTPAPAPTPIPVPPSEEDELMAITVKNPLTGERWSIEDALWSMWTYSYQASVDAKAALAVAKVAAAKGEPLTAEETEAAVREAMEDAVVNVTIGYPPAPTPEA